jgi:hypothetical protein
VITTALVVRIAGRFLKDTASVAFSAGGYKEMCSVFMALGIRSTLLKKNVCTATSHGKYKSQ